VLALESARAPTALACLGCISELVLCARAELPLYIALPKEAMRALTSPPVLSAEDRATCARVDIMLAAEVAGCGGSAGAVVRLLGEQLLLRSPQRLSQLACYCSPPEDSDRAAACQCSSHGAAFKVPARPSKPWESGTAAAAGGSAAFYGSIVNSEQPSYLFATALAGRSFSGLGSSSATEKCDRPPAELAAEVEVVLAAMLDAALPAPRASPPRSSCSFSALSEVGPDVPADLVRTLLGQVRLLQQQEQPAGASTQTTPGSPSHALCAGVGNFRSSYFEDDAVCDDADIEAFRRRVLALEQAARRARGNE
jgi:hypothetical protein